MRHNPLSRLVKKIVYIRSTLPVHVEFCPTFDLPQVGDFAYRVMAIRVLNRWETEGPLAPIAVHFL
jgi:hypothetical protein